MYYNRKEDDTIDIKDEGVTIASNAKSLDFIGAGVTATAVLKDVTANIPGEVTHGDVVGPSSAIDSNFAAFDTTTGKLIKDSGKKASDFQVAGTYSTDIHSNITALNNVSGTNTGDESQSTIKTKLGAATSGNDGYLTSTDWNTFNNKQPAGTYSTDIHSNITALNAVSGTNTGDNATNSQYSGLASSKQDVLVSGTTIKTINSTTLLGSGDISVQTPLGFTPENVTNKVTSLSGSSTDTQYPSAKLVYDQLAGKQPAGNYITLASLSSSATGLSYNNTTGAFSLTSGYVIPTTTEQTNWGTAYTNTHTHSNKSTLDNIQEALTTTLKGNYDTAYSNRITSLTTTGSSGAATLGSNTLNIPNYTLSGLGGQPQLNGTGFVKISGTTISYDNSTYLTANQSITLSGAITGSGTTSISTTLADNTVSAGKMQGASSTKLANGSAGNLLKSLGDGTFGWDTSTYLTSLSGAVLTSQATPQTIGDTTNRLTKLWATDITVTNAINGSVTGNAGTVTNGIYTTSKVTDLTGDTSNKDKYLHTNASTGALEWSTVTGGVFTDPMTTRGDIIVRNASNVTARLGLGATGKVLMSDGTDIGWSASALGTAAYAATTAFEASGAISSHASLQTGVHGISITAGKTLTALKSISFTSADDTSVITLPTGTKTLLATDGSAASLTNFPTLNQNTTGTAAKATVLETTRAIYGNNFDGSADLTQVIASTYGGTGNGFTKFTGPTTSEKTFTLPDENMTIVGLSQTQTLTNKIIQLNPAPADTTYSGETCSFTAGENLTAGQVCYLKSDGKMWLAKSDVMATSGACMISMAMASISANASGIFLMRGFYQNATLFNLTPCVPEYINASTGGALTETAPSTTGNIVRIVGYAKTADIIYFCPDNTYLEI